jgi:hypothetical protein
MAVLRTEVPVAYKTTINRTIVMALKEVFTASYPDGDFQNLNITTDYPLTEIEYPAIVVKYNEQRVLNAGVGHREYFEDPFGGLREWGHRRFEGNLEFTIYALSPLDRDVLSDALIEILSFGRLDPLQNNFFIRVYGAEGVDVGVLGLLHQISVNTDEIEAQGEANQIAPWQPEDVLVYTNGYTTECHGGFYNTVRDTDPLGFIQNSTIIPYLDFSLTRDLNPENQWSLVFDYVDSGTVIGKGVIHAQQDAVDASTVIGMGVIAAADAYIPAPAPDNFIVQSASQPDVGAPANDITLSWPTATIAGNHLFMVVGVRGGVNVFGGVGLTTPAGWTMYQPPHGVQAGPGPGIFVFYKLNAGSESGSYTHTFSGQSIVSELPIRCTGHIFEVNQDVVGSVTGTDANANTTDQFTRGYVNSDPSGGGLLFEASGDHEGGAFVLAFACVPSSANPWHIDDASAQVRSDGWLQFLTSNGLTNDTDSPSLISMGQPDATQSALSSTHTKDLRLYMNNTAYDQGTTFPAALWLRFH